MTKLKMNCIILLLYTLYKALYMMRTTIFLYYNEFVLSTDDVTLAVDYLILVIFIMTHTIRKKCQLIKYKSRN
jgi:hypothetical protein